MTEPKNNMPMVIGVIVLIALAGGAMFYFSKNMKKEDAGASAQTAAGTSETMSTTPQSADNNGEPPATDQEKADATKTASEGFNGVTVKPGNPVVAKVDGQDITRVDVFRYIKMMPQNIQQLPPTAVYPLALDQVINTKIVQSKAEAAKLENDPEVQKDMAQARQQIVRSVYVQRAVDKEISEADLKKKYDELVAKTPEVQEIRAAHILVDSEAKAKDIIAKLDSGEDFAKLAGENSGDPGNKDKGGELGWFAKTDMVPEFADAAFKMGKGDVSKTPVKTQFGWHIIKVEDKRTKPKPGFEEVKPMIQSEVRRERLEAMLADWRKNAKVDRFDINGDPVKDPAPVTGSAGPDSVVTPAPAPAPAAQ